MASADGHETVSCLVSSPQAESSVFPGLQMRPRLKHRTPEIEEPKNVWAVLGHSGPQTSGYQKWIKLDESQHS